MRLVIIRHAIAGDRDAFAAESSLPDAERPVTAEGRKKMRANARGLRAVVPDLGILATSPYTRARETAEIVADVYDGLPVTEVPALAHGGPRDGLLEWLSAQRAESVALVGHEPDLGGLIAWLVTGEVAPFVTLKKGGASLLVCEGPPGPGLAELSWVLTPKLLRRLGDG
jgi:phosphohistidine phosphatase